MKNNRIERHIYRAVEKAPVDLFSKIKSQPVHKMESHDFITRQDIREDSKQFWKPFMAFGSMAAVFLIVFIGWWSQYNPVDSVIYIDVNPSIQVSIDKNEQVIDLKTLKTEDEALIANIDYKNKDLYWVAEQLLDALIAEGYIDTTHHTMLVSVLNDNSEIGNKQSTQLNSSIREHLQKQSIQSVVLRQAITISNTIEDYARDYNISVGKMTFIRNLIILDPDLKVEELVTLSLEDLVRISAKTGLDIKRIIEVDQELDELYQDIDDDNDEYDDGPDDIDDDEYDDKPDDIDDIDDEEYDDEPDDIDVIDDEEYDDEPDDIDDIDDEEYDDEPDDIDGIDDEEYDDELDDIDGIDDDETDETDDIEDIEDIDDVEYDEEPDVIDGIDDEEYNDEPDVIDGIDDEEYNDEPDVIDDIDAEDDLTTAVIQVIEINKAIEIA